MKKTFIAASVLSLFVAGTAFAAQTSEEVPVYFKGKVVKEACKIQVGGQNNVVNLGVMKAEANAKGAIVPVMFRFSNCPANTSLSSIELTGTQNAGSPLDKIADGALGTDRQNLKVQLMTDPSGRWNKGAVEFGVDGLALPQAPGSDTLAVTPFYAQMQAVGGEPDVGDVNSSALFTVTYK